jgi:DNA mismatch repair protein MutL
MTTIRLLPEQVANQIAAGEVVERPASVVKELIENALDAQATRVTVEIQAGGRSLIRVTDDGLGMNRDDALLSLERHATSKIQTVHDLARITTLGFRGEALPSIASVSRMTLTTRERVGQEVAGTRIIIHGGRIIEVNEAGAPGGTCVEVRHLFFNVPARRKFLRSDETERAHVQHYLLLIALAWPQVALTFIQEGRTIWQLPAIEFGSEAATRLGAVRERLRALYGADLKLVPVDFSSILEAPSAEERGTYPCAKHESQQAIPCRLWGFIGAPGVSRATRQDQHLFVNRRPVENRGLNRALLEGYHTSLMKGRFPVCCLFLEIDPAEVDVNIHPSKREAKFRQEHVVKRLVTEAIRQALREYHSRSPAAPLPVSGSSVAPAVQPARPAVAQLLQPTGAFGVAELSHAVQAQFSPLASPPHDPSAAAAPVIARAAGPTPESAPPPAGAAPVSVPAGTAPSMPGAALHLVSTACRSVSEAAPLLAVPLRLVGVVGKLYVVLESDRGLVLMDQHAAHERILFEQLLRRLEQGQAPAQRLLLPETIELSPRDAAFLREQLASLNRLGVGVTEFGERTFLLDALPPFVHVPDARQFVLELVDDLKAAGQAIDSWRLGEQTVAKTVCRHAVKAHDALTGQELEKLIDELRLCQMPYTCPHGRPTLIEMNFREIEKKFGRTQ